MNTYGHLWKYVAELFLEWEKFRQIYRENQNTHFMFNNLPPPKKSCRLWDNVEKYGTARQATDDNAGQGHRQMLIISNTYYFARQQWLRERASILRHTTLPAFFS
jgi:hypothetical protein